MAIVDHARQTLKYLPPLDSAGNTQVVDYETALIRLSEIEKQGHGTPSDFKAIRRQIHHGSGARPASLAKLDRLEPIAVAKRAEIRQQRREAWRGKRIMENETPLTTDAALALASERQQAANVAPRTAALARQAERLRDLEESDQLAAEQIGQYRGQIEMWRNKFSNRLLDQLPGSPFVGDCPRNKVEEARRLAKSVLESMNRSPDAGKAWGKRLRTEEPRLFLNRVFEDQWVEIADARIGSVPGGAYAVKRLAEIWEELAPDVAALVPPPTPPASEGGVDRAKGVTIGPDGIIPRKQQQTKAIPSLNDRFSQ